MKKLALAALLLAARFSFAQISLTYQNPDFLYVCSAYTFTVIIKNNGGEITGPIQLTCGLNGGLEYVVGSVSGGGEFSVGNLAAPVFSVSSLAVGASATLKILISAPCAASAFIDSGQLFFIQLNLTTTSGGTASTTTINFPVETGLAVFESVVPTPFTGTAGDMFDRKIRIKNTRLGRISSLRFSDFRPAGLQISTTGGTVITNNTGFYVADFDGSFIDNFGDGDPFFEKDEVIEIIEKVIIIDCGTPPKDLVSKLRVGWGCGGEECRYDSTTALVKTLPFTNLPNVVVKTRSAPPLNQCAQKPATNFIFLKNTGLAPAVNPLIEVVMFTGLPPVPSVGGFLPTGFRAISSTGVVTNLSPAMDLSQNFADCNISLFQKANMAAPTLAAGDSMTIEVEVFYCADGCIVANQVINGGLFYQKDCPPGGFDSKPFNLGFSPLDTAGFEFSTLIRTNIGACLVEGPSYPYQFEAWSDLLLTQNGVLTFKADIPKGLMLDPDCPLLVNGNAPLSVVQNGSELTVQVATPLNDTIAKMPFCLKYDCAVDLECSEGASLPPRGGSIVIPVPPPGDTTCQSDSLDYLCTLMLHYRASLVADAADDPECGMGDCDSIRVTVVVDCELGGGGGGGGGAGGGGLGSVFDWDFSTARLNYGLADPNGDRLAELPFSSAEGKTGVRRDRIMVGDTVRVAYRGWVPTGGGFNFFPIRIFTEMLQSEAGLNGADNLFATFGSTIFPNYDDGYVWIGSHLTIKYANGQTATCEVAGPNYREDQHVVEFQTVNISPPVFQDRMISEFHDRPLDLASLFANGCLPKGTLDMGDSLFFFNDFKAMANYAIGKPGLENPGLLNFQHAVDWAGDQFAWKNSPRKLMQYSGFREFFRKNTVGIRPCENSQEVQSFRYAIRIARPDLFPFEVRPLSVFDGYKQSAPNGLQLGSALLKYLVLQDSVAVLSNFSYPFSPIGGFIDLKMDTLFSHPLDEGYSFSNSLTWLPNCEFNDPSASTQLLNLSYPPCFRSSQKVEISLENGLGFFSNQADLVGTAQQPLMKLPTSDFAALFSIKNVRVSPANFSWIWFEDVNGGLSGLQLLQNGQPVAAQNGIFQLGTIGSFGSGNFTVTGKNTSCSPEKIKIHYGWGCSPLLLPDTTACGHEVIVIELQLENPELELVILKEPATIPLCAPSDFFEFELLNAKFGHAYDLLASVKLPQGLTVLPGSVEISYPKNAPWQPVADPSASGGNIFLWKINELLPAIAADGLPGVLDAPKNSLKIRFRVIADCGFVAETQPIFGGEGIEPCGKTTNKLRKTGQPISLEGLSQPYTAQVSLSPANGSLPSVGCGQTFKMAVQISLQGAAAAGDSIHILLPTGLSFVAGSYQPGGGAPAGPPIFSGKNGRLLLPTGVTGLFFTFSVKYDSASQCLDQAISVQVRSKATAICVSTGLPCTVSIANGEAIWFFPAQNPEVSLTGFSAVEIAAGIWNFDATLQNVGLVPTSHTTIQLFRDADGDGKIGPGDLFLGNFELNSLLAPGETAHLLGQLAGNPPDLCGLLARFPAAENCACDDLVFPVGENLTLKHLPLVFCQIQNVGPLGVANLPGKTYEWLVPLGSVNLPTGSMATFTPPPGATIGQPFSLVLLEKSLNCTLRHEFEIEFGAVFDLTPQQTTLCLGEKITLTAGPVSSGSYEWSGPGTAGATGPTVDLSPTASAQFSVTVTLASGCSGTAMAFIQVLPSDSITLPKMTTCVGQPVPIFGIPEDQPGVYCKTFQKINGCDSTLCVELRVLPPANSSSPASLCAGNSLTIFGNQIITAGGNYCKTFIGPNGCDSLVCVQVSLLPAPSPSLPDTLTGLVGVPIIIEGPGGFSSWEWGFPFPGCNGCQSPTFTADTAGLYHIPLTVTDANGCRGETEVILRIFPPCDPATIKVPNAFTPNGDGLNDTFQPLPAEGSEAFESLTIFDRWGAKIWSGSGPTAAWNGLIDGKPAPTETYVWLLRVSCLNGPAERIGDVSLIR